MLIFPISSFPPLLEKCPAADIKSTPSHLTEVEFALKIRVHGLGVVGILEQNALLEGDLHMPTETHKYYTRDARHQII